VLYPTLRVLGTNGQKDLSNGPANIQNGIFAAAVLLQTFSFSHVSLSFWGKKAVGVTLDGNQR